MRGLGFNGVIVGLSGDDDKSEFRESGVDRVLLKPINRIILEEAIYLKRWDTYLHTTYWEKEKTESSSSRLFDQH